MPFCIVDDFYIEDSFIRWKITGYYLELCIAYDLRYGMGICKENLLLRSDILNQILDNWVIFIHNNLERGFCINFSV